MTVARLIYCPCPDHACALEIARGLVAEGMAACANIIPGVTSVCRYEDQLQESAEVVLIVKTTEKRAMECRYAIAAAHPYEIPVIVSLQPEHINGAAMQWLAEVTATHTERLRRQE
jgi:periplasmic divalent cation tolerance protein